MPRPLRRHSATGPQFLVSESAIQGIHKTAKWLSRACMVRLTSHRMRTPALKRLDAPGAKVKPDKFCTASQHRKRITNRHSGLVGLWSVGCYMCWARIFLYLYVAQAAGGTAIGFAIPFLHLIAG